MLAARLLPRILIAIDKLYVLPDSDILFLFYMFSVFRFSYRIFDFAFHFSSVVVNIKNKSKNAKENNEKKKKKGTIPFTNLSRDRTAFSYIAMNCKI